MRKKVNMEVLVQLGILFGLASMLFISLVNGNIKKYVHPRLELLLWVSGAVLIIIGIFMIPNLFKPKHCENVLSYGIIIFPIIALLIVPNIETRNEINSNEKFSSVINNYEINSSNKEEFDSQDNNIINVKDEDFAKWYVEIHENKDKYDGTKIEMKGQVLKKDGLKENEFIPARKVMVCCAADAEVYGFICRSSETHKLKENEWVKVIGQIKYEEYENEIVPIIYVEKMEKSQPAKMEYIYFH